MTTEPDINALAARQTGPGIALALGISPAGRLHLDVLHAESDQPAPPSAKSSWLKKNITLDFIDL